MALYEAWKKELAENATTARTQYNDMGKTLLQLGAAYNTAEYIKWYNSSSEKYKKWNKIRENLIDDIVEAEKADTGAGT